MKRIQTFATFLFVALISISSYAQKIKVIEGDLSALKGQKSLTMEFTYNNMKVGKFDKEEDYVDTKRAEYNQKEAGRGDKWAKSWVDDRKNRFEPKFNELFEKHSEIQLSPKGTKYTLIFNTSSTEPGFNVGVWRKNAEINGEVWVVETSNKNNIIAKISLQKALGRTFGGYDFDTGLRIAEAYADAGKAFGKFIKDQLK
ncbi:hypothetical protein [Xanthocytophaga flava]|uniref:hypothetical protein n=1 Tax=Xanthocytophaga flava TaxID=3048013 RepID=UPI0028D5D173|nr:hypothetical protein [Xanthocytophaga flavus]MDJ1470652.1 hypothetical protein [Xanthocytophaga flavus]